MKIAKRFFLLNTFCIFIVSCAPVSGPDKTATGAVLGGGIGAGSGAIIGNQVGMTGAGIAIGAGLAAASGMLSGVGLDLEEGSQLSAHRKLENMHTLNKHNRSRLNAIDAQERKALDTPQNNPAFLQVFFDQKRASLKLASANQIQHVAESLRGRRYGTYAVTLKGYSTDSHLQDENREIISARLMSVKNTLVSYGVPEAYIKEEQTLRASRAPQDVEKDIAKGILMADTSEPLNRYNNRVEIYIKY